MFDYLPKSARMILVLLLMSMVIAGLMWVNYRFASHNPGGNDFLVHYLGTRALIFDGISPYSDVVAQRIQEAAYGRPALEGEHELRVVYPLYSTLLFSPFAMLSDYTLARALWMTCLELSLLITAYLCMQLVDWDPPIWLTGIYFLFTLVWYHAVRGVINGNAVVLITLLITLSFLAIKHGQDRWAGVLLAVSTIKPHLVALLGLFVLLWAAKKDRWQLVGWFIGMMSFLIVGGVVLVPNWILQNTWEILKFPTYNPILSLGELLGSWMPGIALQIRWGLALALGIVLVLEWWSAAGKDYYAFLWTACLTLAIGQWIGIPTDPGNFILLFPGLILVLGTWDKRWQAAGSYIVTAALVILWGGLWALFLLTLERAYQPLQAPVMFLPFPGFVLMGLYWIRWWVMRPSRRMFGGRT